MVDAASCQKIVDGFATKYSLAWAWIEANKQMAVREGYVETAYGGRRYFPGIQRMDNRKQSAAMREGANSPIQGLVAQLLSVAGILLYRFRYRTEAGRRLGYKVLIPIHDAFLIECRAEVADEVKAVLRMCMSTMNQIPGTAGRSLGADIEIYPKSWGKAA